MKLITKKKIIRTTHTTLRLFRFPLWFFIADGGDDDCCCETTTFTALLATNNNGTSSTSSSYGVTAATLRYGVWERGNRADSSRWWWGLPGGRRTVRNCACSFFGNCWSDGRHGQLIHITIIIVLIIKQSVLVLVGAWIDAVPPIRIYVLEIRGIVTGDL